LPGDGGAALLRPPYGRGKPAHRRLYARGAGRRDPRGPGEGLSLLPAPEGAARLASRLYLRRRAADDRDRARADGAAEDDPARRAVDGPRAAAGRGDLRDREAA